jgi:hypothetical protein
VAFCVNCNESLVCLNWLMLHELSLSEKGLSTMQLFIASKMLICFIFCSKFVQTERVFISTMPKCLSDIMIYESRGT